MNPTISIIIPVYNTEKYLPKCLDSAVNQTYKNIEIIVVDDCSSGHCAEIVNSYIQKDDRIVYLKHEINKGLFIARETGINKAVSQYILHVDSDDWIELDLCEKLQEQIQLSPDLIEFGFKFIDESVVDRVYLKVILLNILSKNYSQDFLLYKMSLGLCGVIF